MRQFDINEEIREFHLMTIHAQRFEAIAVVPRTQFERVRDVPGIQPDLKRIII